LKEKNDPNYTQTSKKSASITESVFVAHPKTIELEDKIKKLQETNKTL
jgi:hypothetical protein